MPTYACSVPHGTLSDDQKKRMARAISLRHSEATGAPSFFVQVIFEERLASNCFVGGDLAPRQIWIRADIRSGRSPEIRGNLMLQIMEDVVKVTGTRKEDVWIYICNVEPTDMVEFGHILPEPGRELDWFNQLPPALQNELKQKGDLSDFRL